MSDYPPPPPSAPPQDQPPSPGYPYMTPQIQKQREGLTPSKLDLAKFSDSPASGTSSWSASSLASKSYRTTSQLLNLPDVTLESDVGLIKIVNSVTEALEDLVDPKCTRDLTSLKFEPKGCMWTMDFNPSLRAENYQLEVVCLSSTSEGVTTYVVESSVEPKNTSLQPSIVDPGAKEAKITLEYVALQVRKAVVRCEFPEFPEGCKGRPFREVYQLNARLKSGSFATVCRGTHRATGKKVAIKCVLRKDLQASDDAAIFDEVSILASLKHPNICPLLDFFDEKDCYFLVMELMSGGDLFDRIGRKKSYNEADARDLCRKMFQAILFCHEHSIAHCDMKPKNLLLLDEEDDSYIKLADFGFAARVYGPRSLTKQCGTPFFVAPEILMRNGYDQQSDMWSVGCIVFLLLSGNLPFLGRSQKELFRAIVVGRYEFSEDWGGVSDEARDLVEKLLVTDPDERITAQEALRHKWLKQDYKRLSLIQLSGTSMRLKTFNARMKLRSAMIAVDCVSSLSRKGSWLSTKKLDTSNASNGGNVIPEEEEEEENGKAEGGTSNVTGGLAGLMLKAARQSSIDENNES